MRVAALGLLLLGATALAQRADVLRVLPPAPRTAVTVEVINADAPVHVAPLASSPRRGTLARETRTPFLRRVEGEGCDVWVQLAEHQYVCEQHVRYSAQTARAVPHPEMTPGRLLPHDYAFVAVDGTRAFAHPHDYFADDYVEAFGEGFGVILTGSMFYEGVPFVRTRRRLWIEADQVRPVRGSDFRGVELEGALDVAWARRPNTPVHATRGGRIARRAGRREVVRIVSSERGWSSLTDGTWVRTSELVVPTLSPRPDAVPEDATWIDVDTARQTLVAYRGDAPVYATLVSTGRERPTHETPRGLHRIWVKLAYSDMDNLERDDLHTNYMIERVPWVQYFEGSNGLHAAFWHDEFGRRHSHGCVNLAPHDAEWLFDFTEPAVPAGWTAVLPTDSEPTTMIQVR